MSKDFNIDDLARLNAMEHLFGSLALISLSTFSSINQMKPSAAVKLYRDAVESSALDRKAPADFQVAMMQHLKRVLDNLEVMAQHADLGSNLK